MASPPPAISPTTPRPPPRTMSRDSLLTIPALNGNVAVTGGTGGPFVITFTNALSNREVPPVAITGILGAGAWSLPRRPRVARGVSAALGITIRKELGGTLVLSGDNTDLTGATVVNQGAVTLKHSNALGRLDAFQTLTLTGTIGGTFSRSFNGVTTTSLTGTTVTAASLQAALEALPAIGAGNVRVEAFATTGAVNAAFRIWFQGALADQNVNAVTSATSAGGISVTLAITRIGQSGATTVNSGAALQLDGNLSIGNEALTVNGLGQIQEVQKLSLTGATAGSFTLTFDGQTTSGLAFNASAAQVRDALNGLSTISGRGGNVTVERRDRGAGNVDYFITFGGQFGNPLLGLDLQDLSVAPSGLGATVSSTIQGGSLTFGGTTFLGAARGSGALRNLTGTSTWGTSLPSTVTPSSTTITLNTSPNIIGVDAGQLNLDAIITGGTNTLFKVGAGTLEFRGVAANTYTGQTTVLEGTLNLNKRANAANGAIAGNLVIGDDTGGLNADRVVLMTPDQIVNPANLTVNRSGQLTTVAISSNEVQTVAYTATGGTFTLTFAGQTTGAINFDAAATGAGSVQEALEALTSIDVGDVLVTAAARAYTVTFQGTLANTNLPQMSAASLLTNAGAPVGISLATTSHGFGNEVQAITLNGGNLTGSFTVQYAGSTATNNVAVNTTTRANLQTALQGLANINSGNVKVLGPDSGVNGGIYYVIFTGTLSGANVPRLPRLWAG